MHWSLPWFGYFLSWGLIPFILLRNKPPVSTLAWIWAVLLLPYLGPLAYLVIGNDRVARKRLRAGRELSAAAERAEREITPATATLVAQLKPRVQADLATLSRLNDVALSSAEDVRLLIGGADFFRALAARIDEAHEHIHVEFYTISDDARGREILDRLVAAAQRKVEVRVLADGIGSLGTSRRFFDPLVGAGGKFAWFRTSGILTNRWAINLRNHRKLQIIDGRIAFVGGMNLAREYAGEDPEIGPWRDVQIELTGGVAKKLQAVFADDWYFATGEKLTQRRYYPAPVNEQRHLVQAIPDGPASAEDCE